MNHCSLLAVDPSLTCSGWAAFSLPEGRLFGVGKLRSRPAKFALSVRLEDLQQRVCKLFDDLSLGEEDILICESETTMRDPRAAFKVERVRGIFESVARSRRVEVPGRINPRTVQSEIMGLRGRQIKRPLVKEAAVQVVSSVYSSQLKKLNFDVSLPSLRGNQDIVDAILVGSLAVTRVVSAFRSGRTLDQVFELDMDIKNGRRRRA